jgi:hypothetical protein
MFAFMSGTARLSGGLLHCNMTYMRHVHGAVKAFLLRCSKNFRELSPHRKIGLTIRNISSIRDCRLQGSVQFDFLMPGGGVSGWD